MLNYVVQMEHLQIKQDPPNVKHVQLDIHVLIPERRQADAKKDIIVLVEQPHAPYVLLDTGKMDNLVPRCFLIKKSIIS